MISISTETSVDAPAEVIFGLLNTPSESVRSGQSQSFDNIRPLQNGGHEYDYRFDMVGISLTGTVRTVRHDAPNELGLSYSGDIEATITFTCMEQADETILRAEAEYEMPSRAVEAVAGGMVKAYNQRELEGFVENTRDRVEAAFDPTGDEYGSYSLGDAPWEPEPAPEESE